MSEFVDATIDADTLGILIEAGTYWGDYLEEADRFDELERLDAAIIIAQKSYRDAMRKVEG